MWDKIVDRIQAASLTPEHAEQVIEKYADDVGLTHQDCTNVGIRPGNCNALQEVLEPASKGMVTPEERQGLADAWFSRKFINKLAGVDGKRALRARVNGLTIGGFAKRGHYFERSKAQEPHDPCRKAQQLYSLYLILPLRGRPPSDPYEDIMRVGAMISYKNMMRKACAIKSLENGIKNMLGVGAPGAE